MKKNKVKLPTVKSLEARVWKECVRIIRNKYVHQCICCGKPVEGKQLHTGHYFRKKFIPIQMKYDLRLLRPCCSYCNLRLHGNLEWYSVNLIRQEGADYLLNIAEDIEFYKGEELDTAQKREFLTRLLDKYKSL